MSLHYTVFDYNWNPYLVPINPAFHGSLTDPGCSYMSHFTSKAAPEMKVEWSSKMRVEESSELKAEQRGVWNWKWSGVPNSRSVKWGVHWYRCHTAFLWFQHWWNQIGCFCYPHHQMRVFFPTFVGKKIEESHWDSSTWLQWAGISISPVVVLSTFGLSSRFSRLLLLNLVLPVGMNLFPTHTAPELVKSRIVPSFLTSGMVSHSIWH